MNEQFDFRKYFEDQLTKLKEQEEFLDKKLQQAQNDFDNILEDKIKKLKFKQKEYDQKIMLAQMKGNDAFEDSKESFKNLLSEIKEEYKKIIEDVI